MQIRTRPPCALASRNTLTFCIKIFSSLLTIVVASERKAFIQFCRKVVPRGLEPRTLRLLAVRSNQLCYETHWEKISDARIDAMVSTFLVLARVVAAVAAGQRRVAMQQQQQQQQQQQAAAETAAAAATAVAVTVAAAAAAKRHRGDSSFCGQSPKDFEYISLASRTQCDVVAQLPAGPRKEETSISLLDIGILGSTLFPVVATWAGLCLDSPCVKQETKCAKKFGRPQQPHLYLEP